MLATDFHFEDGRMVVQRTQDCTPIAEHSKALHNEGFHGSGDFKHAASVPLVMIEAYCNRHGLTLAEMNQDPEHVRRMLNDPELAHFRIWKGRV